MTHVMALGKVIISGAAKVMSENPKKNLIEFGGKKNIIKCEERKMFTAH
jgi:hypothetical protein